jgi:hypothetical protein
VTVAVVIAIILATNSPSPDGITGTTAAVINPNLAGDSEPNGSVTPDVVPGTTSDATPDETSAPVIIDDLPTDPMLLGMELYGELLAQYREVIIAAYDENRGSIGWDHVEGLSNTLFTAQDSLGPFHLDTYYYSFYDLNGDGIPELFITRIVGTPSQYSSMGGFGFHTWVEGIIFTPDFHMGGRSGVLILRNGVISIDGSGGAETHHYSFYALSADGKELELAERLTVDSHGGKETEFIRYHDRNGSLSGSDNLTETQFNEIMRSFYGENTGSSSEFNETHQLVWHPLNELP